MSVRARQLNPTLQPDTIVVASSDEESQVLAESSARAAKKPRLSASTSRRTSELGKQTSAAGAAEQDRRRLSVAKTGPSCKRCSRIHRYSPAAKSHASVLDLLYTCLPSVSHFSFKPRSLADLVCISSVERRFDVFLRAALLEATSETILHALEDCANAARVRRVELDDGKIIIRAELFENPAVYWQFRREDRHVGSRTFAGNASLSELASMAPYSICLTLRSAAEAEPEKVTNISSSFSNIASVNLYVYQLACSTGIPPSALAASFQQFWESRQESGDGPEQFEAVLANSRLSFGSMVTLGRLVKKYMKSSTTTVLDQLLLAQPKHRLTAYEVKGDISYASRILLSSLRRCRCCRSAL